MGEIKAIETVYNGYRFRSRLEARWAVFFDSLGIKYQYEPEGFDLGDGIFYLPDFYLPESKTFFEAKGVLSEIDKNKIERFIANSRKPIVIGYEGFEFEACDYWGDGNYEITSKSESYLCKCLKCNKWFFMGVCGSFTCRCCGAYDGDGHFVSVLNGDIEWRTLSEKDSRDMEVIKALNKARQARFEYGETPEVI